MGSQVTTAAAIWARAGLKSGKKAALIKERYDALFTQSLTAGGLDTVTQATKNSVSMGKSVGLSVIETMEALGRALEWIDAGAVPSQTRSYGRF